ncbi:hypothetical protein I547_7016 [Mycobacterium kansasii 824]|uniref:Restriction endonuclease type II-like domain-containing protein n=1 Tax=Mycobacterium kansasii TaxID=1768 RepID=A0A1V3X2J2_MYCKA|nr:hypothetical protein I547_7016 [Mycobacterium kansasii 824]OOK72721.1 hypothetical protein BZL29_4817 [Mycobacterium kansasii]
MAVLGCSGICRGGHSGAGHARDVRARRIDKGYEELRVGIEYDGPQHWTDPEQRDRDIDRYTALHDLGWTIIRVSNKLLRYRQGTFIGRVVAAMQAAGWRR